MVGIYTYLSYPFGSLALLARVFYWQSRGHRFDSDMLHTDNQDLADLQGLFYWKQRPLWKFQWQWFFVIFGDVLT